MVWQRLRKVALFLFGISCYLIALSSFAWLIAFCHPQIRLLLPSLHFDFSQFAKVAFNILLILLWGIIHSVMARDCFKDVIYRFIPKAAERSIYVLVASVTLILIMWLWQPIPVLVWQINNVFIQICVLLIFVFSVIFILFSTYLTNHFDLFGVRQIWMSIKGIKYQQVPFTKEAMYRFIRHPMMLGLLLLVWASNQMCLDHLIFSFGISIYILIGTYFEEKGLEKELGKQFQEYKKGTFKLVPFIY